MVPIRWDTDIAGGLSGQAGMDERLAQLAISRAKGPCALFCKTRGCNKLDDPPEPFLNESALRRYDTARIGSARTGLVIEWV